VKPVRRAAGKFSFQLQIFHCGLDDDVRMVQRNLRRCRVDAVHASTRLVRGEGVVLDAVAIQLGDGGHAFGHLGGVDIAENHGQFRALIHCAMPAPMTPAPMTAVCVTGPVRNQ